MKSLKRVLSVLLSIVMVFSLVGVTSFASGKTPADFGWSNDSNDFTGWLASGDGTITAARADVNVHRIWHSVNDKDNFDLTLTVQPTVHRVYIRMFGQNIFLNIEGGNGNQTYCENPDNSVSNDWINATNCIVTLHAVRKEGGNVACTLTGKNGGAMTFTLVPSEENENVEVGFLDSDDAAIISGFEVKAPEVSSIPEGATTVIFSGSGDWVPANISPDNTKSYELGYDLNFVSIQEATSPDTWADDTRLVIRNGAVDPYINVQIQTYLNNNSKYQIFVRVQEWTGSSWVTYAENWSSDYDDPIETLHAVYQYDKAGVFAWTISDKATGTELVSGTTEGSEILEAITTCLTAELKMYRNNNNIKFTNAYILYKAETPIVFDKTPADFGWSNDSNDFTGWLASGDGTIKAARSDVNVNRIWHSVNDKDNFSLSVTVQPTVHRVYIRMFGQNISLNIEWGNGNQAYCEVPDVDVADDWLVASGGTVTLKAERVLGGNVNCTLIGKAGGTRTFVLKPAEENENVEIGFWDSDDAVIISEFSVTDPETFTPGEFGWSNDGNDFTGWVADTAGTITADRANVNVNRIWHSVTDKDNFKLTVTLQPTNHRVYLRMFGQNICINVEGGNGNQAYIEVPDNSVASDWIYAKGGAVTLMAVRKGGGNVDCTLTGKNGAAFSFTLTPSEENENVEIGFWDSDDAVVISGFEVSEPVENGIVDNMKTTAFTKIVVSGDMAGDWLDQLVSDFLRYQNVAPPSEVAEYNAESILASKGDLIILASGRDDLLSGRPASVYQNELESILSEIVSDKVVVVVASVPYQNGLEPELTAEYTAAAYASAKKFGTLFADLYNAFSAADYMLEEDSTTFSALGNALVEGEILHELMRACPCLAVNATVDPTLTKVTVALDASTLQDFKNASTVAAMKQAIENEKLGLNLRTYRNLELKSQTKVINALIGYDRSGVATVAEADALLQKAVVSVGYDRKKATRTTFGTWVAVGDSITVGETSVNKAKDAWVPILHDLIESLQGETLTLINKAISGTRMCTRTENDQFPPASETVQSYIVANDPDLLTIAYGINDLNAGTDLTTFINTYQTYLNEVIAGCPDTLVVVCGMGPTGNDNKATEIRQWNAAIKSLTEELGLIYVETYYDTYGINWLLTDGLHPTNAGYRVIANAVLRGIGAYVNFGGVASEEPKTPADFGWSNDGDDFTGWKANGEGTITAAKADVNVQRIWHILGNQDNFDLTVTVQPTAHRVYLRMFGQDISVSIEGGNGNQAYCENPDNSVSNDWIDAASGIVTLHAVRKEGGNVACTLTGKNGGMMTFTLAPAEENENIEIGFWDSDDAVIISGFEVKEPEVVVETKTPGDFGWENDSNDFTGWTATDAANFSAENSKVVNNRVWKGLLTNQDTFTLTLTIANDGDASSGFVKLFGHTVELDSRHGTGKQAYYKLDNQGYDWISSSDNAYKVVATRENGGKISVTITGTGNSLSSFLELDATDPKPEVELGIYAGKVTFSGITYSTTASHEGHVNTLYDFGWRNDTNDFTGWTAVDAANFSGNLSEAVNQRVWKNLYPSVENFKVTADITVGTASEAYIRIFGKDIQLDTRHSQKDEVSVKLSGVDMGWVSTNGFKVHTEIMRKGSGAINATITGASGDPVTFEITPAESNTNYELGLHAGTASFNNIAASKADSSETPEPEKPATTPGDFGWENDDNNFTGWYAESETNFSVVYDEVACKRIWKQYLEDTENFELQVDFVIGLESSMYLQVLEANVELDARHGNGAQVGGKLNQDWIDWIDAAGRKVTVTMVRRDGGSLEITISAGGELKMTVNQLVVKDTIEIGIHEGTGEVLDIRVGKPGEVKKDEDEPDTPTEPEPETKPVEENDPQVVENVESYGWHNYNDDFVGWEFEGGSHFGGTRENLSVNRVTKELISDPNKFAFEMVIHLGENSEAYLKLMGRKYTLARGTGDEVTITADDGTRTTLQAKNGTVNLTAVREAGKDVEFVFTGLDNETPVTYTVSAKEESKEVEVAINAGTVLFTSVDAAMSQAELKATESGDPVTKRIAVAGDSGKKEDEPKKSVNVGLIIGISAGAVVLAGAAVALIAASKKRRKKV